MKPIAGLAVLLGLALVLPAAAAPVTLTGEVTYRERIALPPNATLSVKLLDVSLQDTSATVHADAQIASKGQVPLTFTLNFDDSVFKPGHTYALSAEISAGGTVWFRNTTQETVDPANLGAPMKVLVNLVRGSTEPVPPPPALPALLDTFWRAEAIGGRAVLPNAETSLTIAADLRAGGKGGCNSYFAQADLDGDKISFSAVAGTLMACAEPINAQERAFFDALGATSAYKIEGDLLFLLDAKGQELVRLTRTLG